MRYCMLHAKSSVGVIMHWRLAIQAAACLLPGLALAAEPTGEWRVANGAANIRIDDCDGALWGIISWEKEPGIDSHNPDPAERSRPTLGLPILRSMRPTKPGLWEGEVYNAVNGKTYSSRISLTAPDVLRIEGCVLGGLICGGENWTRVKAAETAPAAPPAARTATTPRRSTRSAPAALTGCSGLTDGAGAAHNAH
jgi:uncharacterized protein (DUF2147 family)